MPGPRCLQPRCTCSGTNEAQKPVPDRRLADSVGASRTSGNASYRLCAQIKDERSVRWCNRLERNRLASFVKDPSIECASGQPRHACCDEAAQRLLESRSWTHGKAIRLQWPGRSAAAARHSVFSVLHRARVELDHGVASYEEHMADAWSANESAGREGKHARTPGRCAYDVAKAA